MALDKHKILWYTNNGRLIKLQGGNLMKFLKRLTIVIAVVFSLAMLSACDSSEAGKKNNSSEAESEENNAVFDFKFTVNGEEYTIPAPFEDFAAKGWEYSYEADEKVPAHKYLIGGSIKKDEMTPSVYFMNDSDDDITVTKADISMIGFDMFDMKNNEIKYGDNIVMGKTTIDELKAAFGEPESEYNNEELGFTAIEYKKDVYIKVEFTFNESGVLDDLKLTNQPDLY